jgi:hypothetical protein
MAGYTTGSADPSEHKLSFSVLSDPHNHGDSWTNALLEIRDRNVNPQPEFSPSELIVVAGDMNPVKSRYKDFQHVFIDATPAFLPVIGNHEFDNSGVHFRYIRDHLIPPLHAVRRHGTSCDYYLDHENVRFIVVDGYTDLGKNGVINNKGRQWVEQAITSAPSFIDHIFISFHEPAFPRFRHIGNSFDQAPDQRNQFWQMLLRYKDRVRAIFVGHSHFYYRMRVSDPAGQAANDPNAFPNQKDGIYQINAGAAGNGKVNTLVQVQVNGRVLLFRTLQAANGASRPFSVIDKWRWPAISELP